LKALGYVGWLFVAWLVVTLALFHDLRTMERKEVRRFVEATCSTGFPPEDFHVEALDHTLEGTLGPELIEGCHAARRMLESELAGVRQERQDHWQGEMKEATWH
jgi:hypothetical protein